MVNLEIVETPSLNWNVDAPFKKTEVESASGILITKEDSLIELTIYPYTSINLALISKSTSYPLASLISCLL